MNKMFYEKYSKVLEKNLTKFSYSHKYQRNIGIVQDDETTVSKAEGESTDYDEMIFAQEITDVTENDGEHSDNDELFNLENTNGTDTDGQSTGDDFIYLSGTERTSADGESKEDEYYLQS